MYYNNISFKNPLFYSIFRFLHQGASVDYYVTEYDIICYELAYDIITIMLYPRVRKITIAFWRIAIEFTRIRVVLYAIHNISHDVGVVGSYISFFLFFFFFAHSKAYRKSLYTAPEPIDTLYRGIIIIYKVVGTDNYLPFAKTPYTSNTYWVRGRLFYYFESRFSSTLFTRGARDCLLVF